MSTLHFTSDTFQARSTIQGLRSKQTEAHIKVHTTGIILQDLKLKGDGGSHHEGGCGGGGRWAAHDALMARLRREDQRFLGRLCNVLYVREPSLVVAVNAAMSEVCHLPTLLLVADR